MEAIARPKSLTETVTEQLRESIVSGDLQLGEALSERVLAERLQVSKTPVREALALLRTEGLVRILPQKGAYVFTLSAREVVGICEFRHAIETATLRLALERSREALAADIADIVREMEAAQKIGDTRAYLGLDTDFHAAFFRHCGNTYLSDTYARYAGKIAALRTHLAMKPLHTKLSLEEHKRLRDIFRDGTPEEAEAVLTAHIGRTREAYSESVEDIAAADSVGTAG